MPAPHRVKSRKGRDGKKVRFFQNGGWKRLGLGIIAILSLVGLTAFGPTEPKSDYESLRLLTEVLNEISQKAVTQKNEREIFQGALRGMMNSLDPDSSYLSAEELARLQKGSQRPVAEAGMELVFKDHLLTAVSVLDGGPAARAGLKAGDHILKIDGQLIRNITTQEGVRYFQGPAGKTLKLQVLRNGLVKPLDLSVSLELLGPAPIKVKKLQDVFAYVRLPYFTDDTPRALAQELTQLTKLTPPLKGLILDLRNNARGTLEQAVRTASLFLGNQKVVTTRGRLSGSEQSYQGSEREQVIKPPFPLVVLVNQGTARAAEVVAGALQHSFRAILLGDKTFGLCGLTQLMPLPDGSALMMTVAYCHTPGGKKIAGDGIKPDIEGKKPPEGTELLTLPTPNPEDDPWVQQALEVLKGGKPSHLAKEAPNS
jgi:carboxyl-terminal processing protease